MSKIVSMARETLKVEVIRGFEELEELEPFHVDKLLWGTKEIPETYGYLGFVPGDGFCLKMVCKEKNPLRTYTEDNDPVYRDSAMEAFFKFEAERGDINPVYLNFEVNANGALLAGYGKERIYRTYFSREEREGFCCKTEIAEDEWSVRLKLPVELLETIYGRMEMDTGTQFTCNFYKISEDAAIEHYASFSPIHTDTPSFHLPEYFAQAEIVDRNLDNK